MRYKVLVMPTESGLQEKVERHLRTGWRLQGGASVATALGPTGQYYHTVYCQAMVLEDELVFRMVEGTDNAVPGQAAHR